VLDATTRGLGVEPPAAGGQRGFGNGAPNAAAIFLDFSKNKAFLSIFWSKFLLKNVSAKCVDAPPRGLCAPGLSLLFSSFFKK